MTKQTRIAFTLVEMLVVIAINSILAAILVPVFAQARGKSRQAACISNQRQLGMAVLQYAQDYDEVLPNGVNFTHGQQMWGGEGWAGQCLPYIRNTGIFHCASDPTYARPGLTAVSYGYNYNLVNGDDYPDDDIAAGLSLSEMTAPTRSVMLFEVAGVPVNIGGSGDGAESGQATPYFSASGNGLDNRLYAHTDWSTGIDNTYSTGYLGSRKPFDPTATQFPDPYGRHNGGSNFLLCDGHVRWMRGASVSSGLKGKVSYCTSSLICVNGCTSF